jgi:hypothetical protein
MPEYFKIVRAAVDRLSKFLAAAFARVVPLELFHERFTGSSPDG